MTAAPRKHKWSAHARGGWPCPSCALARYAPCFGGAQWFTGPQPNVSADAIASDPAHASSRSAGGDTHSSAPSGGLDSSHHPHPAARATADGADQLSRAGTPPLAAAAADSPLTWSQSGTSGHLAGVDLGAQPRWPEHHHRPGAAGPAPTPQLEAGARPAGKVLTWGVDQHAGQPAQDHSEILPLLALGSGWAAAHSPVRAHQARTAASTPRAARAPAARQGEAAGSFTAAVTKRLKSVRRTLSVRTLRPSTSLTASRDSSVLLVLPAAAAAAACDDDYAAEHPRGSSAVLRATASGGQGREARRLLPVGSGGAAGGAVAHDPAGHGQLASQASRDGLRGAERQGQAAGALPRHLSVPAAATSRGNAPVAGAVAAAGVAMAAAAAAAAGLPPMPPWARQHAAVSDRPSRRSSEHDGGGGGYVDAPASPFSTAAAAAQQRQPAPVIVDPPPGPGGSGGTAWPGGTARLRARRSAELLRLPYGGSREGVARPAPLQRLSATTSASERQTVATGSKHRSDQHPTVQSPSEVAQLRGGSSVGRASPPAPLLQPAETSGSGGAPRGSAPRWFFNPLRFSFGGRSSATATATATTTPSTAHEQHTNDAPSTMDGALPFGRIHSRGALSARSSIHHAGAAHAGQQPSDFMLAAMIEATAHDSPPVTTSAQHDDHDSAAPAAASGASNRRFSDVERFGHLPAARLLSASASEAPAGAAGDASAFDVVFNAGSSAQQVASVVDSSVASGAAYDPHQAYNAAVFAAARQREAYQLVYMPHPQDMMIEAMGSFWTQQPTTQNPAAQGAPRAQHAARDSSAVASAGTPLSLFKGPAAWLGRTAAAEGGSVGSVGTISSGRSSAQVVADEGATAGASGAGQTQQGASPQRRRPRPPPKRTSSRSSLASAIRVAMVRADAPSAGGTGSRGAARAGLRSGTAQSGGGRPGAAPKQRRAPLPLAEVRSATTAAAASDTQPTSPRAGAGPAPTLFSAGNGTLPGASIAGTLLVSAVQQEERQPAQMTVTSAMPRFQNALDLDLDDAHV